MLGDVALAQHMALTGDDLRCAEYPMHGRPTLRADIDGRIGKSLQTLETVATGRAARCRAGGIFIDGHRHKMRPFCRRIKRKAGLLRMPLQPSACGSAIMGAVAWTRVHASVCIRFQFYTRSKHNCLLVDKLRRRNR